MTSCPGHIPREGPPINDAKEMRYHTPKKDTGSCLHHAQSYLKSSFPHQAFSLKPHLKMDPLSSQSYIGHFSSLFLHLSLPQWCLPAGPEDTGPQSIQTRLQCCQKLKFQSVLRRPTSHLCPLTRALSGSQSDGKSQTRFNHSCDAN